jgi:pimeloyl-ACP methyl ester carboxylesterase
VLLLHGGLGGIFSWQAQIPALAAEYRVFAVEQRGRGRTPDAEGPISYELLTDDAAAFIERVAGGPAHVVGASDGGIVGLLLALRRPELVRRLVTIGANFHRDGLMPDSGWADASADDPAWEMPRQRYAALSPDGPDHWPVVFAKLTRMWNEEPTLTQSELAAIVLPVLVMSSDDDAVALSHTATLYEALPNGQLAVVPGTSHAVFVEKPQLVNRLILDFLAELEPPSTLLPIRRRRPDGSPMAVD